MATPVPPDLLTDPEAMRRAIIAKIGITPDKLAAFGGGPAFDDQVRNLYRQTTGTFGNLDLNEARTKQDYEQGLALTQNNQRLDTRRLTNDLADRGLLTSGAAINRRAQLGTDYANRIQALNQAQTRGLENIGVARNESLNSLLSGKSAYEASYTQQLQDWLQQQAATAAQTALGQQVAAAVKPVASVAKTSTAPRTTAPKITTASVPTVRPKVTPVKLSGGVTGYRAPGGRTQF